MPNKKLPSQKGFADIIALSVVLVIILIATAGYQSYSSVNRSTGSNQTPKVPAVTQDADKKPEAAVKKKPAVKKTVPKPTPAHTFTTPIKIKGNTVCRTNTLDALKLLKNKAPGHYNTAVEYIDIIECAPRGSGMFAYEESPRFLVGDATRNAGTIWYAGTIVHEAIHSKQYHDYLDAHPGESVPAHIWTGEASERSCLKVQHDALSKIGATKQQLDYVKNVINTKYYEVPYEERWW